MWRFDKEKNKVRDVFLMAQNGLTVTNIDIQTVEPVDQRTRDSLMKSVQLAIEITTSSQVRFFSAYINLL